MSRSRLLSRWLVGSALALMAAGAFAGEITLFEQPDFQGRYVATHDALPSLARAGFDNLASSIVIASGTWEACTEAYFQGRCTRLSPGRYDSLPGVLNDRISSVREIAYAEPPASVSVAPPAFVAPPGDTRIVLYAHSRSGERSIELSSTMRDLDRANFGDRADAAMVYGGVWRLCDNTRGRGECTELAPGRYDTLGALDGRVNSVELVVPATRQVGVITAPVPRVVLYEYRDFGGRSLTIEGNEARDLDRLHFGDRAASMRVEAGSWMLCSGAYFEGQCRTFGPGEYPRLSGDLDRRVSSARPIADIRVGALTYVPR